MQRIALSTLAIALLATTTASLAAGQNRDYNHDRRQDQRNLRADTATVVRVEEQFSHNRGYQYQECWNDRTRQNEGGYYRDEDGRLHQYDGRRSGGNASGAVIGAIIGGALGNQVGKGNGRTAATVAGAVIGAGIGNRTGHNDYDDGYDRYRDDSGRTLRCRMVDDDDYDDRYGSRYGNYRGNANYLVSYRYAGQMYQAVTSTRPGRYLRVLVDVQPQDAPVSYNH